MTEVKSKRLLSIDRFRGFLVFAMCFFIIAGDFPSLGFISTIANNSKTTVIMIRNSFPFADLENPSFIFLISLSYFGSFKKRYEQDKKNAYKHFIKRYLTFMGIGSIMVSIEYFFTGNGKDPFIFLTILMFLAIGLLITYLILNLFKIKGKFKDYIYKIFGYILITLGIIGIILGIRDDILLISGSNLEIYEHWSILHEIGFTGLLGLLIVRFNLKNKIISWFYLVIIYSFIMLLPGSIKLFDEVVLGGLIGCFGWLIILLGGIILMEFFKNKKYKEYILSCLIIALLACFFEYVMPFNTSAGTTNYLLISLFIDACIFSFFNLFNNKELKYDYLVWWGRNPLPIFLLNLIFRLIEKMWNPSFNTSLLVAFSFTFGILFINSLIAYYLYKKDIIIKI